MFNRKIEGAPRSRIVSELAFYRRQTDCFNPTPHIDRKMLELASLFDQEEQLASLICDDQKMVERETIERAVATSRNIARAGFPLQMIGLDEILDIAQIYSHSDPICSEIDRLLRKFDPRKELSHSTTEHILFVLENIRRLGPDPRTAATILDNLLATLDDKENTAWTARVAAALAYFSALEN